MYIFSSSSFSLFSTPLICCNLKYLQFFLFIYGSVYFLKYFLQWRISCPSCNWEIKRHLSAALQFGTFRKSKRLYRISRLANLNPIFRWVIRRLSGCSGRLGCDPLSMGKCCVATQRFGASDIAIAVITLQKIYKKRMWPYYTYKIVRYMEL
jgi:hypothetical protein